MVPRPGILIDDRYELLELIASGGQGAIWRAHDRKENRDVAAKLLTDQGARNSEYAIRLAREQEALIALAGTSALAVFDLCRSTDGFPCLITELLEGMDLERHLSELEGRKERLTTPALFEILDPIAGTLERAHEVGIIHRDLKPANIYLVSDAMGGGVRLLDFGLSRLKSRSGLTAMGTIMGSPAYIAPEVWRGNPDQLDHRVDVYSIAVVIFRALTGALPFDATTTYQKYRLITTAERPSLRALRPDLPPAIDEWTARALAVDPTERFASMRELMSALSTSMGYAPPKRAPRPVAKSLVAAWRAATSAFQRFVHTNIVAASEREKLPPPPPVSLDALAVLDALESDVARDETLVAPADGLFAELDDADVLYEPSPSSLPSPPDIAGAGAAGPGSPADANGVQVDARMKAAASSAENRARRRALRRKRNKAREKAQHRH